MERNAEETRVEEFGVIASILMEPSSIKDVCSTLRPEMFTNEMAMKTYKTALFLFNCCEEINAETLLNELQSEECTRDSIRAFFKGCLTSNITSAYITHYADAIIKSYKARRATEIFKTHSLLPKDINSSLGAIVNDLESLLNDNSIKVVSTKDMVAQYKDNYFCEKKTWGIMSGFDKLDKCIGGFEGGNIYVFGARPAVGKSAFAVQMISQMAEKGHKICYYNLEMSAKQVFERNVAQNSKIDLNRLKNAIAFLGDEQQEYEKSLQLIENLNVDTVTGSLSLSELRQMLRYKDYDIIVIDYLQLISSEKNYNNRSSEVGYISKMLKKMSLELNIPIVLLSQLNRVSESKCDKEPTMSELRESGDIEQDASVIALIWNISDDGKVKGLKVDKNRQGELCSIAYEFIGPHAYFVELEEKVSDLKYNYDPKFQFKKARKVPF